MLKVVEGIVEVVVPQIFESQGGDSALPQWRSIQRMVKHMVHFLNGAGEKLEYVS